MPQPLQTPMGRRRACHRRLEIAWLLQMLGADDPLCHLELPNLMSCEVR